MELLIKVFQTILDSLNVIMNAIESRKKEYNLLVEWFEQFKQQFGEMPEAQETVNQALNALGKYKDTVPKYLVPLAIKNARNKKKAEGSVLEYGLDGHLERMNGALDKGCPRDPRFPERDNEWVANRQKEQKVLVEWLETFKSDFAGVPEADPTVQECEKVLLSSHLFTSIRFLLIQNVPSLSILLDQFLTLVCRFLKNIMKKLKLLESH
jgi:hypothetical protein